jgi:hypothetical protein
LAGDAEPPASTLTHAPRTQAPASDPGSPPSSWRSDHAAALALPAQASGARRLPPEPGVDSLHSSSARTRAPSSSASPSPSAKASVGTNTSAHLVVPARHETVKRPATLRALQRLPVVEAREVDQRADIHPRRPDRARDLPPSSYRFGGERTVARRGQTPHQDHRPLPRRDQLPHARLGRPGPLHHPRQERRPLQPARTPTPAPDQIRRKPTD